MSQQYNNDNNTTLIFIGPNKTTHKTRTPQDGISTRKKKVYVLKQSYFNVEEENTIILEYFNLRTNAL
jgi:hypothetical protein